MVTYRTKGGHCCFIFLTLKHFPENACIFQKKNISLHKISCARQFESKLSLRSLA